MKIKSILFAIGLFLVTGLAIGQTISIDGEIHTRAEFKNGYKLNADKNMKFQLGQSEMFSTETLGYLQVNANTSDYKKNGTWAYLMLTFSPNFYTSK